MVYSNKKLTYLALILLVSFIIFLAVFLGFFATSKKFDANLTAKSAVTENSITQSDSKLDQTTNNTQITSAQNSAKEKSFLETVKETIKKTIAPITQQKLTATVNIAVPFTPQAPFAEWDDPRQQDGCEEASLTMAWHWLQNKSLTPTIAKAEILNLYQKVVELFGEVADTSAEDTAKLFKEYYHYDKIRVVYDVNSQLIKNELKAGHVVLVPADGTILKNPYYTAPGPIRHMIVIKGYDDKRQEFITNDPGTRRGADFRFSYNVVIKAIVNYSTGNHGSLIDGRKVAIIVEK